MHRFLTTFLCLSTLAMTQNVVAGTPSVLPTLETRAITVGGDAMGRLGQAVGPDSVGGEGPSPATMMLFVTGLAGLSAVGGRQRVAKRSPRA